METMLNHTTKPIVFVTTEFSGCVDAIEMAEAVAGGADALRLNPFVACYINVTTGLRHNQESLEKLLFLSGKGLPALYIPVSLGGATAPITVAGCQVLWNVGALVGLVISQLKREGAPYVIAGWGASMLDMRDLVQPYADPDRTFISLAIGQFLQAAHTLEHFRERWYPSLIDRGNYDSWLARGGKTLEQRAAERADQILAEHQPEPLPAGVARAVHEIVERAVDQYA
jgi:trimethylamine:corrinoid methyltransferase-like protein